jgi:hypothetical protein
MSAGRPFTIAFFWNGVSPTMAACWRTLAAVPDTRLVVFFETTREAQYGV